jgi:hypothetical protein
MTKIATLYHRLIQNDNSAREIGKLHNFLSIKYFEQNTIIENVFHNRKVRENYYNFSYGHIQVGAIVTVLFIHESIKAIYMLKTLTFLDVAQIDHDNVTLLDLHGAHEYIYASKSTHVSLHGILFIYLLFIYSFTSIIQHIMIVKFVLKIRNCKGNAVLFILCFSLFCFDELITCYCWNVCN